MIIQKQSREGIASKLYLVTHNVLGKYFNRALVRIDELETTKGISSVFRVLG